MVLGVYVKSFESFEFQKKFLVEIEAKILNCFFQKKKL